MYSGYYFDHRGTIFTEYTILKMMHQDAGSMMLSTLLSYNHFRMAWYSYLGLLNIDNTMGFTCNHCGSAPFIFDILRKVKPPPHQLYPVIHELLKKASAPFDIPANQTNDLNCAHSDDSYFPALSNSSWPWFICCRYCQKSKRLHKTWDLTSHTFTRNIHALL